MHTLTDEEALSLALHYLNNELTEIHVKWIHRLDETTQKAIRVLKELLDYDSSLTSNTK